jgi:hypothetical protein
MINTVQYGVTVSIKGFHSLDPGSTPGIGNFHINTLQYGVTVSIKGFHSLDPGSTPGIGN